MNVVKIIFSYDRPLQLDGLLRSIGDWTDLAPERIVCLCRSSSRAFREAYASVGEARGVRMIHENRLLPGVDFRRIDRLLARLPRGRTRLGRLLRRATTPVSLERLILAAAEGADFVSFAVDDMCYFRPASFERAGAILGDDPDIAIWSWRIGADLQPHPDMAIFPDHWTLPHRGAPVPYGYLFHTDGSLLRRSTLEQWFAKLPRRGVSTLNHLEAHLWERYLEAPERFSLGSLHAGPAEQACITWQINKVSPEGGAMFTDEPRTAPDRLLADFRQGARLDFSRLPAGTGWIREINRDADAPATHLAATGRALDLWTSCLAPRETGGRGPLG